MRSKNVIFMTILFMMGVLLCGIAYGQGGPALLGAHSPALIYNQPIKLFMSVHQIYNGYFLFGLYVDPWGNFVGGFHPAWNSGVDDERAKPAIAYDAVNSSSLRVWTGPWPYHDLYGQLNSDVSLSDSFVISNAPGAQANPVVTNDAVNGGFLVTWSDDRNMDGLAIYGQLVSAEGEFRGTEILIASGFFRGQVPSSYSVTYDHVNQRFLVVWISVQSIHGQFINANGTLQGEEFSIGDPEFYEPTGIPHIAIAYDGTNQKYLVVWDSIFNRDIFGLLVSADGSPVGNVFSISTYSGSNPSIAFDNINQRFLVAWTWGFTDGQFVNPDGTLQGDRLSISHKGAFPYHYDDPPAIAFNPECGNFLVASVARLDSGMKDLIAVESEISYTVVGDPCPSATLTVKKKGYRTKKSLVVRNIGYGCKRNNSCKHIVGSEVAITAIPDDKAAFESWTGCDTVTDNVCYVTMDNDKKITAKFTKIH